MSTNTKIALAAALVFGAASAALANDIDESASGAQVQRDWLEWQRGLGQNHNEIGNAGSAYGYVASPTHTPRTSRTKGR